MKIEICIKKEMYIKKEFKVKYLEVVAGIKYAEDVSVNGEECNKLLDIPCYDATNDCWRIIIDVETGVIINWESGKIASVDSKICGNGVYTLLDKKLKEIKTIKGYVLNCLAIGEDGHGDYIILNIDEDGKIKGWKPRFDEFMEEE